jgi:excisionase family DNA binding protein
MTAQPERKAAARAATVAWTNMHRIQEAHAMPRTQLPSDRDLETAAFTHFRARHHHGDQIFFTITEVAERLHVATRTVRRWIAADDLVVHRIGGVVRIAERDLRAFLALHRDG